MFRLSQTEVLRFIWFTVRRPRTTTASGTNTFLFFDDFSSADPSTLNGYYQESTLSTVNLEQRKHGRDTISPFLHCSAEPLRRNARRGHVHLLGLVWPAFLGSPVASAGRFDDLVNWTKYSSNPVIPVATGCSRPSVILVSTTYKHGL